jgi:hypothetical protein
MMNETKEVDAFSFKNLDDEEERNKVLALINSHE